MKLKWIGDRTEPSRFVVNSEHVRGEGVCYLLEGPPGQSKVGNNRRFFPADQKAAEGIETDFYGRGGKGKVKAAAQAIADRVAAQSIPLRCRDCSREFEDGDEAYAHDDQSVIRVVGSTVTFTDEGYVLCHGCEQKAHG